LNLSLNKIDLRGVAMVNDFVAALGARQRPSLQPQPWRWFAILQRAKLRKGYPFTSSQ
jgi:hypothetical protein